MRDVLTKDAPELQLASGQATDLIFYVKRDTPETGAAICGKVEWEKEEDDVDYYREVAFGYIWIVFTDCSGNVESKVQHYCMPDRILKLRREDCYGFKCYTSRFVNLNGVIHIVENGIASGLTEIKSIKTKCRGNACTDVSVKWTGSGYNIRNSGNRRVRVKIRFTFGLACLDWTSIELDPGASKKYGNGGYCLPYEAKYI